MFLLYFQDFKKSLRRNWKEKLNEEQSTNEFDFKKARHEVFKFGISGLEKDEKYEAKVAHAISLGAKVYSLHNNYLP